MSLIERQDYHRGVSGQFPIAPQRIVGVAENTYTLPECPSVVGP